MSIRKELIELECLAKVHELNRKRKRDQPEPPAPKKTAERVAPPAVDDREARLRTRFSEQAPAFSWRKLPEKSLVICSEVSVWLYVASVLVAWLLLRFGDERSTLSALLMFGPRWLVSLPLIVLGPLALLLRARLLLPLFLAGLVTCFGIVGVCWPWPWDGGDHDMPGSLSLITCNVREADGHRVKQVLGSEPDVVALQEARSEMLVAIPKSMHRFMSGKLVIASTFPIMEKNRCEATDSSDPSHVVAIYAKLETPNGPIGVCNVHFTCLDSELYDFMNNPARSGDENRNLMTRLLDQQNYESQRVAQWFLKLPRVDIVLGSFGSPVESRTHQHWGDYDNAFSRVGWGLGFTQRAQARRFNYGLRTEHVLVGDGWEPLTCTVGSPVGSDHLPVLAHIKPIED